ncbi:MAG: aldose 1-epimerase [Clostridia bacterium]|nr:aldose 1-epimerase [Clostridia bacterium]
MFVTYTIKSGGWCAEVAPNLGANVTSLTLDGREVFVPLKSRDQLEENPYIQGAPLLLPANRTAEGRFTFEGREYTLPITEPKTGANLHGLLHRQPFTLVSCNEKCIVLEYKNQGEIYPFPFTITVVYGFESDSFMQRYIIKNTGDTNMPLTFALHTSFVEPESFTVPIDACQRKDEKHIPIGGYHPLDEQEQRYITGSPSKGISASGYYRACGRTATIGNLNYTASEGFDHWILFNGAGKCGLLCVEPQCGAVNGLNTPDGCKILAPGEELELYTRLSRRKQ